MESSTGSERASDGSQRVIVRRYALARLIGRGGNGEVWEALDTLSNERVAVKLLGPATENAPAAVRREVAALRLLRIPGVVRLRDEGVDAGAAFLVMDLVEGAPFPGATGRCTWKAIAPTVVALLETLGRIHAAGVVHRDLKPGNVLVQRDGRPTVLDFGLAHGSFGSVHSAVQTIVGTPDYLAPEQALGEPVTPRTDLYSLGVTLFEALAGQLPHPRGDLLATLIARTQVRPPPLRDLAPDVPAKVAEVIDRMLERAPEHRPASALDVLRLLLGREVPRPDEAPFPRLGAYDTRDAALARLRAGRPVDLRGEPGSGRTRCIQEIAEALARDRAAVAYASPARRPFASLEAVVGALDECWSRPLAEVSPIVEAHVRAALDTGVVLVVDGADQIDPWSASVIERCRASGAVLRALPPGATSDAVLEMEPLDEAALAPLFAGPERLLHLPSDAARLLRARTEGWPARVVAEVNAWVRAGIARWDRGRVVIDRAALDELASGLRVTLPLRGVGARTSMAPRPMLPRHLEDLLAWIDLAWPHTRIEVLAAATAQPVWRVEAEFGELEQMGLLRRLSGAQVESTYSAQLDAPWDARRLRAAHRALAAALPVGVEGRLLHLVASLEGEGDADRAFEEVAAEAIALARRRADEGKLGLAIAAVTEGYQVAQRLQGRRVADPTVQEAILSAWVDIALSEGTPRALDRALYEVCRATPQTPAVQALETLVRAALAARAGGDRALAMAESLGPFAHPDLEWWRHGVRVLAARRSPSEREEQVLRDVERWVASRAEPELRASLAGWQGRLCYRQGRYDDAAALHKIAARGEVRVPRRLGAMTSVASALLEGFRHEEAAAWADEARALARRCRHPYFEARAEWIGRAVACRVGRADAPDGALLEAVGRLGENDVEALIYMNEAAVARSVGRPDEARALAAHARHIWAETGWLAGAMFARCVEVEAGATPDPGELAALVARATVCPLPRIGVQALGLLGRVSPSDCAGTRAAALRMAGDVPRAFWSLRMEVLSVDEAIAALRDAGDENGIDAALRR